MAFDFLGPAGAGAAGALDDLLVRQLAQQQFRAQLEQFQRRMELEQQQLNQRARESEDERLFRGEQQARQARLDRQGENRQGVRRMIGDAIMQRQGPLNTEDRRGLAALQAEAGDTIDPRLLAEPEPEPLLTKTVNVGGRPVIKGLTRRQLESGEFTEYREPEKGPQMSPEWVVNAQGQIVKRVPQAGDKPYEKPTKPSASEGERKNAGLYQEAQKAIAVMDLLEPQLTDRDLYQIQSLPQEGLMGGFNRSQMSPAALRYLNALDQLAEARLRALSGATITTAEIAQGRRTYGKQYGETPQLSTQRQAARKAALATIQSMAGQGMADSLAEIRIERDANGKLTVVKR